MSSSAYNRITWYDADLHPIDSIDSFNSGVCILLRKFDLCSQGGSDYRLDLTDKSQRYPASKTQAHCLDISAIRGVRRQFDRDVQLPVPITHMATNLTNLTSRSNCRRTPLMAEYPGNAPDLDAGVPLVIVVRSSSIIDRPASIDRNFRRKECIPRN